METDSISIPFEIDFDASPQLKHEDSGLEESIGAVLELIVFTPRGSFDADPDFGFEYWNHEFSNINLREFNNNYIEAMADMGGRREVSRQECEASLRQSILDYEPRLLNPDVRVEMVSNPIVRYGKSPSKYQMKIRISGELDEGLGINRPYEKRISFLVEPTSHKSNA